jgi:glycerol-3-phosphate cytidylyltransferase
MNLIKGITFGAFDLCHAGHAFLFEYCKRHCDYLIVGLHVNPSLERDNKNAPVMSLLERQILVKSNRYVDEIFCYETERDIEIILSTHDLNVRFLGDDYKSKDFTGKLICTLKNIKLMYCDRNHSFSTSELRERIKSS